jgi:hypothetical protein
VWSAILRDLVAFGISFNLGPPCRYTSCSINEAGMQVATITIEPETTLAKALEQAAATGDVITVRAGDASYTMHVEQEGAQVDRRRPTPGEVKAVRDALAKAAGGWTGVDGEAFKKYLRERRKTANRPSLEL